MHRLLMLVMFECFCFVKKIVSYKCVPKAYANSLSCVASIKSVHLSNSKAKLENTNTISTYSHVLWTDPQLSIIIIYNSTWSIVIQYIRIILSGDNLT